MAHTSPTTRALLAMAACAAGAPSLLARPQLGKPRRVSVDQAGAQAAQGSFWPAISGDARYVAFTSFAALTANDANGLSDVYVFDLGAGTAPELVSVNLAGASGSLESRDDVDISGDGRYVAFWSAANDLVAGDTNFSGDAFVRDRGNGVTELASVSTSGAQGHALKLALSDDGRTVVFSSVSNLLAPPDFNGVADVFVRDRASATTTIVSVTPSGAPGNAASGAFDELDVSRDGRFVVFASAASDLIAGDTNGAQDVFVRDRALAVTIRASLATGGAQANGASYDPKLSSDGRCVVFASYATNLAGLDTNGARDVFLRDLLLARTELVSVGLLGVEANGESRAPNISPDGRFASFQSRADNLVATDTNTLWDTFARDRLAKKTVRLNGGMQGAEPDGEGGPATLADGAMFAAFASAASNLVVGDTNGASDAFVRRWITSNVYCTAKTNSLGCASAIAATGTPSASSASGFVVSAANIRNQKVGLLIYSTTGFADVPFQGGTLCISAPIRRTTQQSSGGSAIGDDCTGSFALDFNARIASGADASLVAGARVWTQFWSRDPGFPPPHNSNLTDALTFEIGP